MPAQTVNTDGWAATQAAWRTLFKGVTLILCFLHAFLKIRERAQHLKEAFDALRERVWVRTTLPMPARSPAASPVAGVGFEASDKPIVREKVLSLCDKRDAFVKAYAHPGCHGRATRWTGYCDGSTTICTARSICTALRRRLNSGCEVGR